jgi:hypothetical protein
MGRAREGRYGTVQKTAQVRFIALRLPASTALVLQVNDCGEIDDEKIDIVVLIEITGRDAVNLLNLAIDSIRRVSKRNLSAGLEIEANFLRRIPECR